jgi:hypothetical protein
MRLRVDDDWAYFYFLVPAIISFFFSLAVIVTALQRKKIHKRRFDQLTFLIACFSLIQSLSWFRARYERHTLLCEVQEYLFQFSTLMESSLALIICSTIHYTIKTGRAPPWYHSKIILWLTLPLFSFIPSCALGTAKLFCPFNAHHDLYYPNLVSSSPAHLQRFIGYITCYLCPMAVSWISSGYYSYSTSRYAKEHYQQNTAAASVSLSTANPSPLTRVVSIGGGSPSTSLLTTPLTPTTPSLNTDDPLTMTNFPSSVAALHSRHTLTSSSLSPSGPNRIIFIAMQLRLYPIVLALCMLPLCSFFFLVITLNTEYHPLLFIGALLVNSTGTINGIVYLLIVRQSIRKSRARSAAAPGGRGQTRSSFQSRRGFQSINYHLVISRLIKSSGQSFNLEADGEEAEEGEEGETRDDDDGEWSEEEESDEDDEEVTNSRSHHSSSYASSISQVMKDAFTF